MDLQINVAKDIGKIGPDHVYALYVKTSEDIKSLIGKPLEVQLKSRWIKYLRN